MRLKRPKAGWLRRIVTTPAYMLAQTIAEAATGIEKLVTRVLVLAE